MWVGKKQLKGLMVKCSSDYLGTDDAGGVHVRCLGGFGAHAAWSAHLEVGLPTSGGAWHVVLDI